MYVNILRYRHGRYLWWALALVAVCVGLYMSQDVALPRGGSSWQGYVLGSVAALLVLWLAWMGIRKRSYQASRGTLQGWVSAHIYLGLALPPVALMHSAFQFGLNVHTLTLLLLLGVVLSGVYGLYAYLRLPPAMVENRDNQSFDERLAELDRLDKLGLELAADCDESVQALVSSAIERSAIGGGLLDQLLARDRSQVLLPADDGVRPLAGNPGQRRVIDFLVAKLPDTSKPGEAERLRALLAVSSRRGELLQRLRRELALQSRLRIWLAFHVPLTVALLGALAVHVLTVFFYW